MFSLRCIAAPLKFEQHISDFCVRKTKMCVSCDILALLSRYNMIISIEPLYVSNMYIYIVTCINLTVCQHD